MSSKKRKLKEILDEDVDDMDLYDMSDSEDEYTETEKHLLEEVRAKRVPENFDSEDEVYGLQDKNDEKSYEEDEPDSMESDIEGLQENYDLPNERAWGKQKRAYYNTDYVDPDYASTNQKDSMDADIEEQEARNIQKRLAEQLDDADFGFDLMQTETDVVDDRQDSEQIVKADLSKLSKRQKQALMLKESPEFMELVNDLKDRLTEVRDILEPFIKLVDEGKYPDCAGITFIKTKYQLTLNYCINISFYLMLKAKRLPVNSHPVIKRLAQYRQLLNQLESGQGKLLNQVVELLDAVQKKQPLYNTIDNTEIHNEGQKQISRVGSAKVKRAMQDNEISKKSILKLTNEEEDRKEKMPVVDETEVKDIDVMEENQETMDEFNNEEKRGITYQISKNKGLTPHRKKEQRNPRVKHRNKYRKAKIRRKGAVREVRKEITRYGGEISGIKAGVRKSIKLK